MAVNCSVVRIQTETQCLPIGNGTCRLHEREIRTVVCTDDVSGQVEEHTYVGDWSIGKDCTPGEEIGGGGAAG